MTRHFCTFFDKNYLARGMALYYSLSEHAPDFTLWIVCMDDASFAMLEGMKLAKVKLLRASEVENEKMLSVKNTRTPIEYSWMFGSRLPLYLLETIGLDMITYLDADLYFYSSVEKIYGAFGNGSTMIIPHGYSAKHADREKTSGIYNVGMLIFKNDPDALECLHWWNDACVEWCFNRYEDGKMGDQMYLNDWPTRFRGVRVLADLGADVAPWNIDRFIFQSRGGSIMGREKASSSSSSFSLIFYHFHGVKIYMAGRGKVRMYPITIYNKEIYRRYLKGLQKAYDSIHSIDASWAYGCVKKLDIFRRIKQYITISIAR